MTYVMCLTSGILYHLIISSGRGGAADFFVRNGGDLADRRLVYFFRSTLITLYSWVTSRMSMSKSA